MENQTASFDASALRDEFNKLVVADLLGPAKGPTELIDERNVRGRYIVGLLAPKGQSALPEEQSAESLTSEDMDGELDTNEREEDEGDIGAGRAEKVAVSMLPSSIGLTFRVDANTSALLLEARWGQYRREEVPEEQYKNKDGTYRRLWQRSQREGTSGPIPLRDGRMQTWRPEPEKQPDVVVEGMMRHNDDDSWTVTLFLLNAQEEQLPKDAYWVFQPELRVTSSDGRAIFRRHPISSNNGDPEQKMMAMLYRRQVEFAVGHGVAVEADVEHGHTDRDSFASAKEQALERATALRTVVVPSYDVHQTTSPTADEIPSLANLTLDMKELSTLKTGEFGGHLNALVNAYRDWIEELERRIKRVSYKGLNAPVEAENTGGMEVAAGDTDLVPHLSAAHGAIARCNETLSRIQAGIELLDRDEHAALAFAFTNRAMYLQRVQAMYAADARRGASPNFREIESEPKNYTWRAFQLAFVLINLPGLVDPTHPQRAEIADLLWFPTGGGKTEAYLGVAAYTMAIRRLQGEVGSFAGHAGLTVLMRYTLRLLTLQQFQRATTLICACEKIRRDSPEIWGSEPFRIGLWVGRNTTPNYTADADDAVKRIRNKGPMGQGQGTPHQLNNCPWCGMEIQPGKHIEVETYEKGRCRTLIYCGDDMGRCLFSQARSPGEGLPVLVVDEEIYRRLPALLIATVDKFAQLPWNGRISMLFGRVDGYCERHGYLSPEIEDNESHLARPRHGLESAKTIAAGPLRPPDLIIQDELHLISGPLGSLVGLYESAVNELCSWEVEGKRVWPKVIASTATIRQAREQVHSLFDRHVRVFPPSGLDVEDNFFSRHQEPSLKHPGRRYLGICAPGIRHKTALIQTYTSFLAAAQKLYIEYGAAIDPWMTLVGYFNSLRELGSMRRASEDSVSARLRRMEQRGLATRFLNTFGIDELTSRLSATQIPQSLDKLETPFDPLQEVHREKQDRSAPRPIDVLLATNMISVGVDVSRLGLMVVGGQPKTTAEYIQATSRVGRSHPGLVATVFNWTRPRDLSHYERFGHYHATFYQNVEALSVTPFSAGALQRGLSALLVSYVRHLGHDFNANHDAAEIKECHDFVEQAIKAIPQRAEKIEVQPGEEQISQMLRVRLEHWVQKAKNLQGARLGYRGMRDGQTVGLLNAPEDSRWELFTCLNSLRNVEPTANLILDDHGMDRQDSNAWTFERAEGE